MQRTRKKLNNKTRVVSIVHVSNTLGCCNPIQEISDLAHQKEELNKKEETIRYEMCGIHGAIVALEQLIEEVTEDKEKAN